MNRFFTFFRDMSTLVNEDLDLYLNTPLLFSTLDNVVHWILWELDADPKLEDLQDFLLSRLCTEGFKDHFYGLQLYEFWMRNCVSVSLLLFCRCVHVSLSSQPADELSLV